MTQKGKPQENWSRREIRFLRRNYLNKSLKQIAHALNRSYSSVTNQSTLLRLYEKQVNRKIKPLKKLTEIEKAYIAGLTDGEGSISIRIRYNDAGIPFSAIPIVGITNSDQEVIDWIASLANWGKWKGTGSYRQKLSRRSFIKEPKMCFTIGICGRARIQAFLASILPYLRIKKAVAERMLEFFQLHSFRKRYTLEVWQKVLEIRELIDSRKNQNVESRQRLLQFIKDLERKEQNQ